MKRYERMSKEEILAELKDAGWNVSCTHIYQWLTEEIKMKKVHRYELIKSPEDVDRLRNEFVSICDKQLCSACRYSSFHSVWNVGCFGNFLKEEIEVEE